MIKRTISIDALNMIITGACKEDGDRIKIGDKVVYQGLGNRSGLHSSIPIIIRERWEKIGKNLLKKINDLNDGDIVSILCFHNITRDRGRWSVSHEYLIKK